MTREERHQHILRTARALFIEHGFEHVTIADVIAASNVARGTFYLHFESLEQLLGELFDQVVDQTWKTVAPLILDQSIPFEDCAAAVIRAAFEIFAEDENLGIVFGTGGGRQFRQKRQEALYDRLGKLIVQAADRHDETIPNLEWIVAIMISVVGEMSYYAATHESLQHDEARKTAFLEKVMSFAMAGLERELAPFIHMRRRTASTQSNTDVI